MFFIDEISKNKMSRKKVLLPLNQKDKRRGSLVMLMTPNTNASIGVMNHPLINPRFFESYYIEKQPLYYTNSAADPRAEADIADSQSVTEDVNVDMVIKPKSTGIVVNGFAYDINRIRQALNTNLVRNLEKVYGVDLGRDRITINIGNSPSAPESVSGNEITMHGVYSYKEDVYGSFERYAVFMLHLCFGLKHTREKCNYAVLFAGALVMSGTYNYNVSKTYFPYDRAVKNLAEIINLWFNNGGKPKAFVKYVLGKGRYDVISKTLGKKVKDIVGKNINDFLNNTFDFTTESGSQYLKDSSAAAVKGDHVFFSENVIMPFTEADASFDMIIRRSLYAYIMKTMADVRQHYNVIREEVPYIKFTFNNLSLYKDKNMFLDFGFYNDIFFKNAHFPALRLRKIYQDFMDRLVNDKRFNSYKKKLIVIPVDAWKKPGKDVWKIMDDVNPVSVIFRLIYEGDINTLREIFKDNDVLFLGSRSFFVTDFTEMKDVKAMVPLFTRFLRKVSNGELPDDEAESDSDEVDSPGVITANIIDKIERTQKLNFTSVKPSIANINPATQIHAVSTVKNKSGEETVEDTKKADSATNAAELNKDELKEELVNRVAKAASGAETEEDAMDKMDEDERIKEILAILATEPDEGINMSAARTSRMLKLQDDFMDKEIQGKKISEILSDKNGVASANVPTTELPVDSINPEWQKMKYMNVNKTYSLERDILSLFNFFTELKHPLAIQDIKADDTSTSEDAIITYTVVYENEVGKRYRIVIDVPKLIDGKYMKLRGWRKNISTQLFPMPIMKIDSDCVQIATIYNKCFITRGNANTGKSNVDTDKLMKTLRKFESPKIKLKEGDSTVINNRYEVPIDYLDIGSVYTEIITPSYRFIFDQDKLNKEYGDKIDPSRGFAVGWDKRSKEIIYYNALKKEDAFMFLSAFISTCIATDVPGFDEALSKATSSVKYTYSQVKILNMNIPVVILLSYYEGLESVLKKAGIEYKITDKINTFPKVTYDFIRFKEGYIAYKLDYSSSLLMNGLKAVNTRDISLADINKRITYTDMLDIFSEGGRIKADGLDNFYELFIDPITKESLQYFKLPTDNCSVILYANDLLTDNKYIKHTNLTSNRRIRHNELIADMLYREVLSKAYGRYSIEIKHRGIDKALFSCARDELIKAVLVNCTTEDQSILNALREHEGYSKITASGPGGINQERAFDLAKRSFDDSMLGVMSMSTSFAVNVGTDRQVTIDANVDGTRGYINNNTDSTTLTELNPTQAFCMTESLTPYGITRDDPFRSAMNFGQTSNHGVRVHNMTPLLVTTGADEALPYMVSNTFAYKAKQDGKIVAKTDEYIVVEYKDGSHDLVNLEEKTEKNSSSGYFVPLKLDTDLKVGDVVKADSILAYDKHSFSDKVGHTDHLAYNIGTLAKIGILYTDDSFEDSATISSDLSKALATEIILRKDVSITKNTSVFNMVKKGQAISEGDPLMVIQSDFDDDDANMLMKNLIGDDSFVNDLGRRVIRSKVTGVIQDIVMYRTCEVSEMSDTLKKIWNSYSSEIERKKKTMRSYGLDVEANMEYPTTEKLEQSGKLKNCEDGVFIEIYMKFNDLASVGDKMTYYSALKGVIKDIFPEGLEPKSTFRPNEKVHTLLSVDGIVARMTCAVLVICGLNKLMVEMSRWVKDQLDIPYDDTNIFDPDEL